MSPRVFTVRQGRGPTSALLRAKEINVDFFFLIHGSFIMIILRTQLHGNNSKSNNFKVLNWSWKFYNTIVFDNTVVLLQHLCHQNCNIIMLLWHSRHLFQQRALWSWGLCGFSSSGACQWICPSTLIRLPWCFSAVYNLNFSLNVLGGQPWGKFLSEWQFRHNHVGQAVSCIFCCQINSLPPRTMTLGLPLIFSQKNKMQLTVQVRSGP